MLCSCLLNKILVHKQLRLTVAHERQRIALDKMELKFPMSRVDEKPEWPSADDGVVLAMEQDKMLAATDQLTDFDF